MTLNQLIDTCCEKYSDMPALGMAFEKPLTYAELKKRIHLLAAWLKECGARKGDRIVILAENSLHWGTAYLAAVRLGCVAVPILPDFPEDDVKNILTEAEAKIVFATSRHVDKIKGLAGHPPKQLVLFDDLKSCAGELTAVKFTDCLAQADRNTGPLPHDYNDTKEDDLASIIYTSGTSGYSKAVMLSHKNLTANVRSAEAVIAISHPCTFLSILPLSHAYEFTIGFLLALANGARIVYAGARPTPTTLEKICSAERPDAICLVPMVIEKIYKKKVRPAIDRNPILKMAACLPVIRRAIHRKIGKRLIKFFGGSLKVAAIGGAPLNLEVENFLREARFPFLTGYGLTETSPLLAAGPFGAPTIAVGSVGQPIPGVEIRIVDPDPGSGVGEILARGENIMKGYYNRPDLNKEIMTPDGWLTTGDLGYLDAQHNLFIKGRSKNVIVLSHGENIYPEAIEDRINSFPEVSESLVLATNDRLEAWINPDYELLETLLTGKTEKQKHEYIAGLLKRIQQEVNRRQPVYAHVAKIVEHREPFVKTATHKIKRYLYTEKKD